ncbi:GSCOCT00004404001.3-RA-CDS, partial [Cotesia congregata]
MEVLTDSFLVLKLFAGWVPLRWSLSLKEKIYNLYTLIIEMILVTFCISCIVDLFLTENIDDIVHTMSMAFTIMTVFAKLTLMTVKRNAILHIFQLLQSDTCIIKSDEEAHIQLGHDKRIKNVTMQYGGLACVAVIAISGASMIENVPTRTLPISGWFPYQHSNSTGYWFAYFHQIIALSYGGMIGLSFDTIAFGVMIQNSSQLRILKHRLENFTEIITKHRQHQNIKILHFSVRSLERKVLQKLINHHQVIIQYSRLSNDVFSPVIFLQYTLSSLILCMCVQSLTKLAFMGPEFVFLLVFLGCMLLQIYLYCWYGNEVMLESMDLSVSIYKMNWYFLTNECKKDLLIMKTRTLEPIKYTSGTLIELSLDSFTNLVKFSYSVYNLLHQR